jgi:hypothetical protein
MSSNPTKPPPPHKFKNSNSGPAAPASAQRDHQIALQVEDQSRLERGTNPFPTVAAAASLHFGLAPLLKLELGPKAVDYRVAPKLDDERLYIQTWNRLEADVQTPYWYHD